MVEQQNPPAQLSRNLSKALPSSATIMPHKHLKSTLAQADKGSKHQDFNHLKVHRLNETRPVDKSHYLMAGLIEIQAGAPIPGQYPGPCVIYIIEGEFQVEDQSKPGEVVKLVAGDVFHVEQGSLITWSSPSKGKAFGVTYAPTNVHPEDMIVKK